MDDNFKVYIKSPQYEYLVEQSGLAQLESLELLLLELIQKQDGIFGSQQ